MLKMSTRSGKRIHGSIHENAVDSVAEVKSERKTRGKHQKENYNDVSLKKKRKNYVRYPCEEDVAAASNAEKLLQRTPRNTLKEQNVIATESETLNDDRTARLLRRTRKSEPANNTETIDSNKEIKTKSSKTNKKIKIVTSENTLEPILQPIKKKSNKKKNKLSSGSLIVEDIPQTNNGKTNLSDMSLETFYSAAGSPVKDNEIIENSKKKLDALSKSTRTTRSHGQENVVVNHEFEDMLSKATRSKMHSVENTNLENAELKTTKKKNIKRKKKLTNENAINNSLSKATNAEDVNNSPVMGVDNIIQDKQLTDSFYNSLSFNNSLKNSSKKRRSKINSSNDKIENLSTFETVYNVNTPDKLIILDTTKENNSKKNSTYDKINVSETNLNASFNKEVFNSISVNHNDETQDVFLKRTKKSLKKKKTSTYDKINVSETNSNATFEKDISNECVNQSEHSENDSTNLNITDKNSIKKGRNLTYDKINDTATNFNATFETEITNGSDNRSFRTIVYNLQDKSILNSTNSNRKTRNSTYDKINFSETSLNATLDEEMCENPMINVSEESQNVLTNGMKSSDKKKRKSSKRKSTFDEIDTSIINLDATYEKDNSNPKIQTVHNETQDKELRKLRQFSKISLDQDESSNLNTTYDKNSITNSQPNSRNNSTFDKSAKISTTFEMVINAKLDATFDKSENNGTRRGLSLISSDTTDNVSSDMSKDISRISVTSDESMVDNVVNTTPFLIESSMDDSRVNISSHEAKKSTKQNTEIENAVSPPKLQKANKDNKDATLEGTNIEMKSKTPPNCEEKGTEMTSKTPLLKRDGTYTEIKYSTPTKSEGRFIETKKVTTPKSKGTFTETKVPNTPIREGTSSPLKREGTFTKYLNVPESPKVINVNKTPTRRKSLPSPGRTPFPAFKNSSKELEKSEKSILNVTRSVEKPKRRSSLVEYLPRATKVMFCSPVATPIVVGQMKGKIIKSNLKGSDKSFVFDESASRSARPPRKRSHTQSEAEGVGSKRKRLTEDQEQSAARLSRPRTTSASGKLQDPGTPSKKASTSNKSKTGVTPTKSKSEGRVLRTKLPNFAALHQKRFAKMESLDECQERKAKRARQLLTPTGSVNLLERISPKEMQPSTEAQPNPKKAETPKKSIIPSEYKGYTRFGFKLNTEVNPFSVSAKTETKTKETQESTIKPLKRQETRLPLPSLAGATKQRKEAAKLTVMREKSFTERRDVKRQENRTIIKGVRTNRRFDLQMKMRNVNN